MGFNSPYAIFNRNQKAVYDGTDPILHPEYLIPADERAILTDPKDDFEAKYAIGNKSQKSTRNTIDVNLMKASRIIYEPMMTAYVLSYVKNNPKIPVNAKIEMYIHLDSHSKKKTVKPKSFPVIFKVNLNTPRHVELFYKDSEAATGHAKPNRQDVCQIYIFIIEKDKDGKDILPTTMEDYWYVGDSSDYHISLAFDIKDIGKELYIFPRWKNNMGPGDFGENKKTIIPR